MENEPDFLDEVDEADAMYFDLGEQVELLQADDGTHRSAEPATCKWWVNVEAHLSGGKVYCQNQ